MGMNEMMRSEAPIVNAYLDQGFVYWSESGERFIPIADMHPVYAGNAAQRMLRAADHWAGCADWFRIKWPVLTLARKPLIKALAKRAGISI
jgi:hypothetical protein